MTRFILSFCCLVLFFHVKTNGVEVNSSPVCIQNLPPNVHFEIRPEMELLAGVLSQTSWMEKRGPIGSGNKYFRELKAFFRNYTDHKAILLARRLTNSGFTYDAPPCFILHLGPLPTLEPATVYSEYLVNRAGGEANLEEFRLALVDLAQKSDFLSFFQKHRPNLQKGLESTVKGFNVDSVIKWLENFYSFTDDEFLLVFAPAFFSEGGYAATINYNGGKKVVAQIIRENGALGKPKFPKGKKLQRYSLHEWSHTYVNDAVDKNMHLLADLDPLFKPVKQIMTQRAYGSVQLFLHEQIIRSVVIVALKELDPLFYRSLLYREMQQGFYLTNYTVNKIEYYMKSRGSFPDFESFVPFLLENYKKDSELLIKGMNRYLW